MWTPQKKKGSFYDFFHLSASLHRSRCGRVSFVACWSEKHWIAKNPVSAVRAPGSDNGSAALGRKAMY